MPFSVRRLQDHPIIHRGMSASLGDNINGPSMIRVPYWVTNPLGLYYLYFAHHDGRSIRLAYSDEVTGPWSIYEPGALKIEHSLFPHDRNQINPTIDQTDHVASIGVTDYLPHIASPDVLVVPEKQQILMYFHGMLEDGNQKTRLALSNDGLAFQPQPELFDHYYYRVFEYEGWVWAISWGGYLFRAPDWGGPFERGQKILEGEPLSSPGQILRHLALMRDGDNLHLFFSRIGDTPEVILHAQILLNRDWAKWQVRPPLEILRSESEWEGALLPIRQSRAGATYVAEHALRDPCIFSDADGRTYLLYSGAAEQAIGIVELIGP